METTGIDSETFAKVLQVVGALCVFGFTLFGGGKCFNWYVQRRAKKNDETDATHVTNRAKEIDADRDAFQIVAKRLELVEGRLDTLQDQLRTQMENNATLTAENKHLQADNERLRATIKELRDHVRTADLTIAELRRELDVLKLRVDGAPPIDVRLVDGEK